MVSGIFVGACDSTQWVTRGIERSEKTTFIAWLTSALLIRAISLMTVGSGLCIQWLRWVVLVALEFWTCCFLLDPFYSFGRVCVQGAVGYCGSLHGPQAFHETMNTKPKTLCGISHGTWLVSGIVEDACNSTQGVTRGNKR